ncbi:MAG: exosortase/archaeosortase family protein, partial [Planctomycetota bacterium]
SHLALVPLIAAWLVFVRRHRFRGFTVRDPWIGCVITLLGVVAFFFGSQYTAFLAYHLGAVAMLAGAVLTVAGREALTKFFPAFLVLGFLTPLPPNVVHQMAQPLMDIAAVATELVLSVLSVPVERTGNMLSINGVDTTVEEACSGIRGIWALTLVAIAFAFATPFRWWVRVLVLASSPLLALLCNIIRLVPTVWVYGNHSAEAADTFHDMAGWVVLFVGYLLLTGMTTLMELLGVQTQRAKIGKAT